MQPIHPTTPRPEPHGRRRRGIIIAVSITVALLAGAGGSMNRLYADLHVDGNVPSEIVIGG